MNSVGKTYMMYKHLLGLLHYFESRLTFVPGKILFPGDGLKPKR